MTKPLLVTSGEPAGIGPDLCISIPEWFSRIVVAGNKQVLAKRAEMLNCTVSLVDYQPGYTPKPGELQVWDFPLPCDVQAGQLEIANAPVVLDMLESSCKACLNGEFSALVTMPVHKGILQKARSDFLGHTEFFQKICQAPEVVMLLASEKMRVALVTTHLPLKDVPEAIKQDKIITVVVLLNQWLKQHLSIKTPKIAISGLNPHAGEDGALGLEEVNIVNPALKLLKEQGIHVIGPMPADTMFLEKDIDAFVAMYHDQGLAVLKYANFSQAVNITLGLPIIRTSVDHGTALTLAGTGNIDLGSCLQALQFADDAAKRE